MAFAAARTNPAWSPLWAWLLPVGVGLGLLAWTRGPAERPIAPAAASSVADPSTADPGGRRMAATIDRAIASTVSLEYGDRDPSGRLRVATGVVINDRGDVLSIRSDPPPSALPGPVGQAAPAPPEIRARDSSGHLHPALWVAADVETGLILLRVEADDLRAIAPSDREPMLGEDVLVIGTPFGLSHSVGRGHVAGLGRRVGLGPWPLNGLIQVQAPLHPGDSGALLADLDGNWLGLVRGIMAPDGPPGPAASGLSDDDLGFAITARDACWVADRLRALGRVDRAYLGVRLAPEAASRAAPEPGAEVTDVVPGSPAAVGDLRVGDRIIALDGRPIRSPEDLGDRLDRTPADAEVAVRLARPGTPEPLARTVRTAVRQPAVPAPSAIVANARPPDPVRERIERLERRIEDLERRDKPGITP